MSECLKTRTKILFGRYQFMVKQFSVLNIMNYQLITRILFILPKIFNKFEQNVNFEDRFGYIELDNEIDWALKAKQQLCHAWVITSRLTDYWQILTQSRRMCQSDGRKVGKQYRHVDHKSYWCLGGRGRPENRGRLRREAILRHNHWQIDHSILSRLSIQTRGWASVVRFDSNRTVARALSKLIEGMLFNAEAWFPANWEFWGLTKAGCRAHFRYKNREKYGGGR